MKPLASRENIKKYCYLYCFLFLAILTQTFAVEATESSPNASLVDHKIYVHVVYFVPNDRTILKEYQSRLDRVMKEVQRFYSDSMALYGYVNKGFQLDLDENGKTRIHVVYGKEPTQSYGRNSSNQVHDEIKTALKSEHLNIDEETIVVFQVLLDWENGKTKETGPYVGGGSHLAGAAYVYDDSLLDPDLLASKESGGYYGSPCSIGEFNSHYIGGVAHELGHAFGLPHASQRKIDRKRGTALMGLGNHTYGQERRNEGPGTFLTRASAMMLANTRPFAGHIDNAREPANSDIVKMKAGCIKGSLLLSGYIKGTPDITGIAAYNDPTEQDGNYDAVAWTCPVRSDGEFQLKIGDLNPGKYQLRLYACHINGQKSKFSYDYEVDSKGKPSTDVFEYTILLKKAVQAFHDANNELMLSILHSLERRYGYVDIVKKKAECLRKLTKPGELLPASQIPEHVKEIELSRIQAEQESVGWIKPMRDQVPYDPYNGCFLEIGGDVFNSGFYAHAPSIYSFKLSGLWKSLDFGYGIHDGCGGSVVFVIRADGREIFRSNRVVGHQLQKANVELTGVDNLELLVEDAGDGNNSDWGVWVEPLLKR